MTKFGLFSLLALFVAAPGCSSDASGDGGVDGTTADAGPDAEPERGDIENFDDCTEDLDCIDPNSECVPVNWFNGVTACLPKCNTTDDCGMNTYCYPTNGGNFGNAFRPMGDHCWFSFCGQFLDDLMVGVAPTGAPCTLGQELGVPPGDELPGWCAPIEDGDWGQCIEAGDTPAGEACDWSFITRVRGGANCDQNSLCIGNESGGFCRQICDGQTVMAGTDPGCTLEPGTVCRDASNPATLSTGYVRRQSTAWCQEASASCVTIGTNTCPAEAGVESGCDIGSTLRPTGLCSTEAQGNLMQGASGCVSDADETSEDNEECAAGLVCVGPSTGGTCRALCTPPARDCIDQTQCGPTMTCNLGKCAPPYSLPAGPSCATIDPTYTCRRLFADNGYDGTQGTADDNFTEEWGACLPP